MLPELFKQITNKLKKTCFISCFTHTNKLSGMPCSFIGGCSNVLQPLCRHSLEIVHTIIPIRLNRLHLCATLFVESACAKAQARRICSHLKFL